MDWGIISNDQSDERAGLLPLLHSFAPISLDQIDATRLMRRYDEKFVFQTGLLPHLLLLLQPHYRVLEVNEQRISRYCNLYFDTRDFKCYLDHHNARASRFKVRMRYYESSGACFLEVKRKKNSLTIKERIPVSAPATVLSREQMKFLEPLIKGQAYSLSASLYNSFLRITLVNATQRERVTLDICLHFHHSGNEESLHGIAVAEVKQEQRLGATAFIQLMLQERIFPDTFSKYCTGMQLIHPGIKHNLFKHKFIQLNKISNALS